MSLYKTVRIEFNEFCKTWNSKNIFNTLIYFNLLNLREDPDIIFSTSCKYLHCLLHLLHNLI